MTPEWVGAWLHWDARGLNDHIVQKETPAASLRPAPESLL